MNCKDIVVEGKIEDPGIKTIIYRVCPAEVFDGKYHQTA